MTCKILISVAEQIAEANQEPEGGQDPVGGQEPEAGVQGQTMDQDQGEADAGQGEFLSFLIRISL